MPSRSGGSAKRRAQIIEAALTCFARKGYTNTTMDDIVAESDLSKGSLYWYFDSKDDLFAAAMASLFEDFGEATLAELEEYEAASEKLRAGARDMVGFCRKAGGLFGLFIEFWSQSDRRAGASQFWSDVLLRYQRVIAGIIEEGVRSGEFKPVDAEQLVWAIMAAYVMMMPDLNLDRVSEAFVETLLSGLEKE